MDDSDYNPEYLIQTDFTSGELCPYCGQVPLFDDGGYAVVCPACGEIVYFPQ